MDKVSLCNCRLLTQVRIKKFKLYWKVEMYLILMQDKIIFLRLGILWHKLRINYKVHPFHSGRMKSWHIPNKTSRKNSSIQGKLLQINSYNNRLTCKCMTCILPCISEAECLRNNLILILKTRNPKTFKHVSNQLINHSMDQSDKEIPTKHSKLLKTWVLRFWHNREILLKSTKVKQKTIMDIYVILNKGMNFKIKSFWNPLKWKINHRRYRLKIMYKQDCKNLWMKCSQKPFISKKVMPLSQLHKRHFRKLPVVTLKSNLKILLSNLSKQTNQKE